MADDNAVDPLGHGSTVWMQELDEAKPLRHAMHVDVSVAREQAEARLAAALAAGGRIVDDSERSGRLDPRRPRRQPRLHRRLAGWRLPPGLERPHARNGIGRHAAKWSRLCQATSSRLASCRMMPGRAR